MELAELNEDERVALVALIVQMVGADSGRSPEEMEEFRAIADEMGRREFDDALRLALARVSSREQAIELARGAFDRPASRELVHTVLVDLASADFVSDEERALIREVAAALGVQTRL